MDFLCHYDSPFGGITLGSDGEALIGVWFDGQRYFGDAFVDEPRRRALPIFDDVRRWLDDYFAGNRPVREFPITMRTTPFRRVVWELMAEIGYGETRTYGELARAAASRLGKPIVSAQAVGGAVGRNSFSIVIPCHRVVGSGRRLVGYAAGLEIKARLLAHEDVDVQEFSPEINVEFPSFQ